MVSRVYVIGLGMGNPDTLTLGAWKALEKSELVIGSRRLVDALEGLSTRRVALTSPQAIADELAASDVAVASVVMSGDVGFYSGARPLLRLLGGMNVEVLPGVSSLSYFCAQLRAPSHDVYATSAHGRDCDVAAVVQAHARSFFLTGGASNVALMCAQLVRRGLGDVRVSVGERLSYEDERIVVGTAAELVEHTFDPLAVMLVENDHPLVPEVMAPSLTDRAFVRGDVPMTKEEVRELAICKLRIAPNATVWDVGSGTGSVTVEAARAAYAGQVLAIERDDEALALTRANVQAFGLTNVRVVEGAAPEALCGLDVPDRVFVGGSGGQLAQVLGAALQANPEVRVCVPIVTLETLSEALRWADELGLQDVEVVQVSVARSRKLGGHHLMQAQNPVFLVTANGPGGARP